MEKKLTWLHISDIHFRPKSAWRDAPARAALLAFLEHGFTDETFAKPDFIFCTGDIAFGEDKAGALQAQYKDAESFFVQLLVCCGNLPRERLFVVPGNHDVNRDEVVTDAQERLVEKARKPNDHHTKINTDFADLNADARQRLVRLKDYQAFTKNFLPAQGDDKRNVYASIVHYGELRIGIGGFNSAWSCGDKQERGQLWLAAQWQFNTVVEKMQDCDLRIGLIHHPNDWFNDVENKFAETRISTKFDVWLTGHKHSQWVTPHYDGKVHIGAGAVGAEDAEEFGFNVTAVDVETGAGEVRLFQYGSGGAGWKRQTIEHHAPDGVWPFKLKAPNNQNLSSPVDSSQLTTEKASSKTSDELLDNERLIAVADEYAKRFSTSLDNSYDRSSYIHRSVVFLPLDASRFDLADEENSVDDDKPLSLTRTPTTTLFQRALAGCPVFLDVVEHHMDAGDRACVVLVGTEGMGKSVEAGETALALMSRSRVNRVLCIVLRCAALLPSATLDVFWNTANVPFPHSAVHQMIQLGWRVVVILEGFDELSPEASATFENIRSECEDIVRRSSGLVVVTSRKIDRLLTEFKYDLPYELQPLSASAVDAYLKKYGCEKFASSAAIQDPRVSQFLRVPFFLDALVNTPNLADSLYGTLTRPALLEAYVKELLKRDFTSIHPEASAMQVDRQVELLFRELRQTAWSLTFHPLTLVTDVAGFLVQDLRVLFVLERGTARFRKGVIRSFLVAHLLSEQLADSDSPNCVLSPVLHRLWDMPNHAPSARTLSEEERQLILSLVLEICNDGGPARAKDVAALWKFDPILVSVAANDRALIKSLCAVLPISEWSLFQSGFCKLVAAVDCGGEAATIRNRRLSSPEEYLLSRLRDANLRYVWHPDAMKFLRKQIMEFPEPFGELVAAIGSEFVFPQMPPGFTKRLLALGFGEQELPDICGYGSIPELMGEFRVFIEHYDRGQVIRAFAIFISFRLVRTLKAALYRFADTAANDAQSRQYFVDTVVVLRKLSADFHHLSPRQRHRLFVDKTFVSNKLADSKSALEKEIGADTVTCAECLATNMPSFAKKRLRNELQRDLVEPLHMEHLPPVKMLQILREKSLGLRANDSRVSTWVEYWAQRMCIWELGSAADLKIVLPPWAELAAVIHSHGWIAGGDAQRLARRDRAGLNFSDEHREYWLSNASSKELRGLLQVGLIERSHAALFTKVTARLLEGSSPAFVRSLFNGKSPVFTLKDVSEDIRNSWMIKSNIRPDVFMLCRLLGLRRIDEELPHAVRKAVIGDAGFLLDRANMLSAGLITSDECWREEQAWIGEIEFKAGRDTSARPFLLKFSERRESGLNSHDVFTHPHTPTEFFLTHDARHSARMKLVADALYCAELKYRGERWVVSNAKGRVGAVNSVERT